MVCFTGNRNGETYTYVKVSWDTWEEVGEYGNITGGSLDFSALSDMRVTGTLEYAGYEEINPNELIRVYYSFTDDFGETFKAPLATMFVEYSEEEFEAEYAYLPDNEFIVNADMRVSGSIKCSSILKVMSDRIYGRPFVVRQGTEYVSTAKSLAEDLGLRVVVTSESSLTRTRAVDTVLEADKSWQSIINYLLEAAGFSASYPNAYGEIVMGRRVDLDEREVIWTFKDGSSSITEPKKVMSNNWQSIENVARMYYENDETAMFCVAKNLSGSRSSLDKRGNRETTLYENVSDVDNSTTIEGSTPAEMLEALKSYAVSKLKNNSSETEYVKVSHPYVPISPNDAVMCIYGTFFHGDMRWKGVVMSMHIELKPSTMCETSLRRFIRPEVNVQITDSGIL